MPDSTIFPILLSQTKLLYWIIFIIAEIINISKSAHPRTETTSHRAVAGQCGVAVGFIQLFNPLLNNRWLWLVKWSDDHFIMFESVISDLELMVCESSDKQSDWLLAMLEYLCHCHIQWCQYSISFLTFLSSVIFRHVDSPFPSQANLFFVFEKNLSHILSDRYQLINLKVGNYLNDFSTVNR